MKPSDSRTAFSRESQRQTTTTTSTEDEPAEYLSCVAHEEIRQVQTTFSDIIDQTCTNDPNSRQSIFEHFDGPSHSLGYLFRSIIPTQETIHQDFDQQSSRHLFQYEDRHDMKYAFKVLDRRTNRLAYEQMPSYHKHGMRLLFCGPVQRELLDTNAIRNFFTRETLRLGKAFDDPKSRKHIPTFVKMYHINLDELLQPNIADYDTFNEFFYRKLKPDARRIDYPNDASGIVSAADCRLIVFDNISDATRIWIKGHHFSLEHLFHDTQLAREFHGGSIAIFRLAPVDYHRFHSPIQGTISHYSKRITGTYYTVNPIAIKENLDILTRNQRTVITIDSTCFETMAFVAIGALLVGSVNFTVGENQPIDKGDELGRNSCCL
jgi:phosphatidylserine decarboxylase precursor